MIVTGFLMKSYRKLREKPETEEYKIERRRADARSTFSKMDAISTQRDAGPTSLIDSLMQMAPERFA